MKNPYFDLQAEMGITKHLGGLESTEKLVKLCRINKDSYVLDMGCGVGATSCYLAKKHGCSVVGVDISKRMIDRAKERAKEQGLEIEFVRADAQKLPFENNSFDAVISESVTAFPNNKAKALKEYRRVTRKGGYVGLCETTWLKPPTKEVSAYIFKNAGGCRPEPFEDWKQLLKSSKLKDVSAECYKIEALDQIIGEIRLTGFKHISMAWYRLIGLCITSSECRKAIKGMAKSASAKPKNLLDYFGYGIYIGRK
ncbi:MAG: class I SAM-dependent methyltransferase [Candidatus Woesearchaeota archaeon]